MPLAADAPATMSEPPRGIVAMKGNHCPRRYPAEPFQKLSLADHGNLSMRRIGNLSEQSQARRFCDYLLTQSIDATTDPESDAPEAVWHIWIREEGDVEPAKAALAEFKAAPNDARYQVHDEASRIRDQKISEHQERAKQQRELMRSTPTSGGGAGTGMGTVAKQQSIPVTIAIIVISAVVSLTSNFSNPRGSRQPGITTLEQKTYYNLSFVDWRDYRESDDSYASVRKGQVWRVITPMFLHGSMMHLAFNMIMLFTLGSVIERLQGSVFFAVLTLVTQIGGMMLQVSLPTADFIPQALHGSPFAVGASGAVYGLFGYLWTRPSVDRSYPIHMPPTNVMLMLGWLVLCMTPLIPNVANGAHLGGLCAGMLAALIVVALRK